MKKILALFASISILIAGSALAGTYDYAIVPNAKHQFAFKVRGFVCELPRTIVHEMIAPVIDWPMARDYKFPYAFGRLLRAGCVQINFDAAMYLLEQRYAEGSITVTSDSFGYTLFGQSLGKQKELTLVLLQ